MCSRCRDSLGDLVRPHTVLSCPMLKSQYCSVCASYGHCPMDCQDALTHDNAPQYLEQLIPPSLLVKYGITSRTPILGVPCLPPPVGKPPIEIPNTEDEVRACLISLGGKPMSCQAIGKEEKREFTENTKRLQRLADSLGRKLILISPQVVISVAKPPTPKTKTFKLKTKAPLE